ncbi:hypothetical protein ABPG75_005398 [Micractinium tetrahymenae]
MAAALKWADLAAPGCLQAPPSHQPACDALLEALLTRGYAVISGHKWVEENGALQAFWAAPAEDKRATAPLQPVEGCGYRELTGDRELMEYRAGPWLCDAPVLPPLLQASEGLDAAARVLLGATLRGRLLRLPGLSALASALDDLPLPPHAWASSSLQCFGYGEQSAGCEGHVDKGLLTLVWAPGAHGLEVRACPRACLPACLQCGAWLPVPPTNLRQLVVLPGHCLEYATCGLVKAAHHRVVLPPGQARCSMVYKLMPSQAASIDLRPALLAAGHALLAADRYPQPASVRGILTAFAGTHRSVNPPRQGQQAGAEKAAQQQVVDLEPEPAAAVAATVAAEAEPSGGVPAAVAAAAAADRGTSSRAAATRGTAGAALHAAAAPAKVPLKRPARAAPRRSRVASESAAASQPPGAKRVRTEADACGKIHIIVQNGAGSKNRFIVFPTTPFSKVFAAHASMLGADLAMMRYVFNGDRLDAHDTPAGVGMRDGDCVDSMMVQMGD